MIDLHCHLLPGIDDGPKDIDAALALARASADAGIGTIVATPHVSWDWHNPPTTISQAVREVEARLAEQRIPIRVVAGAEIELTRAVELSDLELRRLSLGSGPWLLIEPPQAVAVSGVEGLFMHLQSRRHKIVIAHVERCPAFAGDPDMLERLVGNGMLASMTAGAFVGRFGRPVQTFAQQLVARGLVHNVASDAHDCSRRPPGLAAELAIAGLTDQAQWLTEAVPAALLSGTPIPPSPGAWPAGPSRARLLGRLRR